MTAYHFLAVIIILILFVIALWRQSGVLFLVTALSMLLLGILGRLETWELIIVFIIGCVSLVTGIIKLARGDF